jgi:hypothetical protein
MTFALSLSGKMRRSFLVISSATCWCLWKSKNEIIFRHATVPTIRNMICLVLSMVHYWSGCKGKKVEAGLRTWLPEDLDMIPLQALAPVLVDWMMPYHVIVLTVSVLCSVCKCYLVAYVLLACLFRDAYW